MLHSLFLHLVTLTYLVSKVMSFIKKEKKNCEIVRLVLQIFSLPHSVMIVTSDLSKIVDNSEVENDNQVTSKCDKRSYEDFLKVFSPCMLEFGRTLTVALEGQNVDYKMSMCDYVTQAVHSGDLLN